MSEPLEAAPAVTLSQLTADLLHSTVQAAFGFRDGGSIHLHLTGVKDADAKEAIAAALRAAADTL